MWLLLSLACAVTDAPPPGAACAPGFERVRASRVNLRCYVAHGVDEAGQDFSVEGGCRVIATETAEARFEALSPGALQVGSCTVDAGICVRTAAFQRNEGPGIWLEAADVACVSAGGRGGARAR